MAGGSRERSSNYWRAGYCLLAICPFLPEFLMAGVLCVAAFVGCEDLVSSSCFAFPMEKVVHASFNLSYWFLYFFNRGGEVVWLAISYLCAWMGWSFPRRVAAAFGATFIAAVFPYSAMAWAYILNPNCLPSAGGVNICKILGADITAMISSMALEGNNGWQIVSIAVALSGFALFSISSASAMIYFSIKSRSTNK